MRKGANNMKKKFGCLSTIGIIFVVFIVFAAIAGKSYQNDEKESAETKISATEKQSSPNTHKPKAKKNIPVYEKFGLTEEEFLEYQKIFDAVGFTEITKVEKEDSNDKGITSFYVEMKDVEPNKILAPGRTEGNIIYVEIDSNKKLNEISVNFLPVYKDGQVLTKVIAFTELDATQRGVCRRLSEELVKKVLKSPSTAKFCKSTEYRYAKENGIIKCQGYVDSQNSFGATVRTNYMLTYDIVQDKPVEINIDGERIKL